jgi:hypothetical protein
VGDVSTIGLDIAKSVFQAHGADASGAVMFRKKLSRARLLAFFTAQPRCVVAMEACAGAHHWGRELMKLGHTVRLIPRPEPAETRQADPGPSAPGARLSGMAAARASSGLTASLAENRLLQHNRFLADLGEFRFSTRRSA